MKIEIEIQYAAPRVNAHWAEARETHMAVATAIHAISGPGRTADEIWEAPTQSEFDHVCMAVENYLNAGLFKASQDGRYSWGCETIAINAAA